MDDDQNQETGIFLLNAPHRLKPKMNRIAVGRQEKRWAQELADRTTGQEPKRYSSRAIKRWRFRGISAAAAGINFFSDNPGT
jgi:hypothetical protein